MAVTLTHLHPRTPEYDNNGNRQERFSFVKLAGDVSIASTLRHITSVKQVLFGGSLTSYSVSGQTLTLVPPAGQTNGDFTVIGRGKGEG